MKSFLISIDTEGDNLWSWNENSVITTENAKFIPRFQNLCEKYGFLPTYLTNYEMVRDSAYVEFAKDTLRRNACEVGMHLHAWNSPPNFKLADSDLHAAPYLVEYPINIMEEKIKSLTYELQNTFNHKIVSHRAGRWAMNNDYYDLLIKYDYKVDCSVTPHIDWSNHIGGKKENGGSNYKKASEEPYFVKGKKEKGRILEVPVTVRKTKKFFPQDDGFRSNLKAIYHAISGINLWMRPTLNNLEQCLKLIEMIEQEAASYIMFMLHSSELMPGGSPTFKTKDEIEKLYYNMEQIFERASKTFRGKTIGEFSEEIIQND